MSTATNESLVAGAGSGLVLSAGALINPGWEPDQKALIYTRAALASARKADFWTSTFPRGTSDYNSQQVSGTGSAAYTVTDGGSILCAVAAVANSEEIVYNSGFNVANCKTKRWGITTRGALVTATDATTEIYPVQLYDSSGNPQGMVIINGQMFLRVSVGATTDVLSSWVVDTAVHDFSVTFDLTTITAWVDDVAVATQSTLTNLSTNSGEWAVHTKNGAGAAVRSFRAYAAAFGLEMP
jgi:hypothetical protein